ncbi:MAG TPA: hypothetical protein VHQ01_02655, partial [Pyrinomonadaceae bacterium]|nr:hypothetical protein [Pyrinomonadaceae bacterium]
MAPALAILEEENFDKPDVFPTTTTTKISVRFVQTLPLELPVKNHPMKTSQAQPSDKLLQLTAHLENFAMPANQIPLTLLSEKLDAALKIAKTENQFYVAARAVNSVEQRIPASATTRPVRRQRKVLHIYENPLEGLRNTEFRMEAPDAKTV